MKRFIPFGLAIALTGCTFNTPQGQYSLAPSEIDHSVRVSKNEQPTDKAVKLTGHPECDRVVPNNTWVMLHGQKQGSKVNIRPEPNRSAYDGSYGLVGESVKVIGSNDDWYRVRFPQSGHEGWLHCSVANDPNA